MICAEVLSITGYEAELPELLNKGSFISPQRLILKHECRITEWEQVAGTEKFVAHIKNVPGSLWDPFLLLSQPAQKGAVPMRMCFEQHARNPALHHVASPGQTTLLWAHLSDCPRFPQASNKAHHQAQTSMFFLHSLTPQDRTTTTQLATLEWSLVLVTSPHSSPTCNYVLSIPTLYYHSILTPQNTDQNYSEIPPHTSQNGHHHEVYK